MLFRRYDRQYKHGREIGCTSRSNVNERTPPSGAFIECGARWDAITLLRYRNLILIFVTSYTGNNFTRLSGQPTTHQLYSSSVFINRLDGDWSIGWYFEDNRTVFFHQELFRVDV